MNNRKYGDKEVDVCIVGVGAAGGVLAYELSKAGLDVVGIEAGPFWNPQTDFASDELHSYSLSWQDTRLSTGSDPIKFGSNNSGRGVGGGTVHFTGVFYRFHESDFRVKTSDGVAEDWPISYQDLEPYYTKIENDIKVSGPRHFPWGSFNGPYPYPEREPLSANAQIFREGCEALGIRSTVAPLAILSAPFDGRPPCTNRGFCNEGCMPNAKFSTLVQHVPKAIKQGAEILTDSMVTNIMVGKDGKVTGVEFNHEGNNYRQLAKVIVVAAFGVETPRLLFNSACAQHPDGLANSSGMVGKCIMPHSGHDIYAKLDEEIRFYKGTPVMAVSQDFYETNPERGFVRGYSLNAHGNRPLALAKNLAVEAGYWGRELREVMLDFNFYAMATIVGEVLPEERNAVTLSSEKDEYGLPRPQISFSYGENDNKLIKHGVQKANEILEARGGKPIFVVPDTGHVMGGCRMGDDPSRSVVNGFCQSHDIPNLFICGPSVFVTSSGANPTETVMAIAARTADYLASKMQKGKIDKEM
ncbi:GMC family oxidoreductase [Desulfitispora alkaliphila]|uniref:GMC family oxidoreductase n=1 Tax=Desulfitispora alkaliphila TaxID=622674 RepID=UPI003D1B6E3E